MQKARALLSRGPLPLLRFLNIVCFHQPWRVCVDLTTIPVTFVKGVHSLSNLHPQSGFLSGLENTVSVSLPLGNFSNDRCATPLISTLAEDIQLDTPPIQYLQS